MICLLASPLEDPSRLRAFVERCAANSCVPIAVHGPDSEQVYDEIDDHLIHDVEARVPRPPRWIDIVTTWHPDLSGALDLIDGWDDGKHAVEKVVI